MTRETASRPLQSSRGRHVLRERHHPFRLHSHSVRVRAHVFTDTHARAHTRTHTLGANHGAVSGGDTRSQRFSFTLLAKKFHRPTGTHFPRKSNKYKRFPLLGWEVKVENMF